MKRLMLFVSVCVLLLMSAACERSSNYSQQLKREQRQIDEYLSREGYTLLDEFPSDTVFGEKEMYHFPDGIYIQILEKGVGDTIRHGDEIILRYRKSTLDEYAVVEDYWNTMDRPYPDVIKMGDLTNSCEGWQQAFDVMQRSGAHANVIVPSQLGRDATNVIPYLYEMKIRAVPK